MTRLRIVVLGLLFWIVFGIGTLATLLGQFIGIFAYAVTGRDGIRDWVTRTGQGTDGLCNAAFFNGDPRETISSHTGRWILSGQPMPLKFRFVNWLTNLFETNHPLKAIQAPFMGQPL